MARTVGPGYFSFHVKPVVAAARFSGLDLDPTMLDRLETYAEWLRDEGIAAGGLGPGEADRVERRHLADSLLFASEIPVSTPAVWDLGSGAGLPGIPLAIALPDTSFRLIDRSGRRIDLLRRVIRILDLDNCVAEMGEIAHIDGEIDVIVTRATLPANQMAAIGNRLLATGGRVIMGGSWQTPPEHTGWETIEIPPEVLDQSIWLLIMRRE